MKTHAAASWAAFIAVSSRCFSKCSARRQTVPEIMKTPSPALAGEGWGGGLRPLRKRWRRGPRSPRQLCPFKVFKGREHAHLLQRGSFLKPQRGPRTLCRARQARYSPTVSQQEVSHVEARLDRHACNACRARGGTDRDPRRSRHLEGRSEEHTSELQS